MPTTQIDRVNIYRDFLGTWCYSAWTGRECDHSDTLDADCESDARDEVTSMFPAAEIRRVSDVGHV